MFRRLILLLLGSLLCTAPFTAWAQTPIFTSCTQQDRIWSCRVEPPRLRLLKRGDGATVGGPASTLLFMVDGVEETDGRRVIRLQRANPGEWLLLTLSGRAVAGSMELDGRHYSIRCLQNRCSIRSLEGGYPGRVSALAPASLTDSGLGRKAAAYVEDGSRIDLLLLYTPALAAQQGEGLKAYLTHFVDVGNMVLKNSKVDLTLRVVGLHLYDDANAGENVTTEAALNYITDDPAVSQLRDQFGADVVLLLRRYRGGDACGVAWQMASLSDFQALAFGVVETGQYQPSPTGPTYYCEDISLVHEVGHILGCAHDADHDSSGGVFPYSYGYDIPGVFATVMSYDSPRIYYFSNPSILYQGHPIGVVDQADNARTIRQTRVVVANYRLPAVPTGYPIDTPEEIVTQLYVGYFGRSPDATGLSYWVQAYNSGYGLLNMAHSFAASPEAVTLYPYLADSTSTTVEVFITSIYQNLFGRAPEPSGLSYWKGVLQQGAVTAPEMVATVIEGAKASTGSAADKATLENRVHVALYYEQRCLASSPYTPSQGQISHSIIGGVSSDPSTVTAAISQIDALCPPQ